MALALGDLIELATLTALMDQPVTLNKLLAASEMWHELSGRGDLKRQMSAVMRRMLDEGKLTIVDTSSPGVQLVGVDAQMTLERAASGIRADDTVEVTATDEGKSAYLRLARNYYNS